MSRTLPVAAALLALPHLLAMAAARNQPVARVQAAAAKTETVCLVVSPRNKLAAPGAGVAAPQRYLQR